MISVKNLRVGYEDKMIIEDLSLEFPKGEVISIIGPNGCGKSTLLKTLCRMLKPKQGEILLQGAEITKLNTKTVARRMALLSQHNRVPGDITVKQLVYYGRHPYKGLFDRKTKEDEEIVTWAMESTGVLDYKDRMVAALSGGERQRVWLAMVLAQKPEILFLDEPTTYLDISHQLELMELIREINQKLGMTIVMVLHELNQASRYSDRLVVMKKGKIMAYGTPKEVVSKEILKEVYHIQSEIDEDPLSSNPRIHPMTIYKEKEVNAKLIPLEVGGFKGDYAKGVEEALLLVVKTFVKPVAQKRETYNLLGCNVDQFQFASDFNEVKRMMKVYFDKEVEAVFTAPSSIESLEKAAAARLNIVFRKEALPAAKWMEEKFGIPYVYKKPYGVAGTIEFVNAIAETTSWALNQAVFNAEIAEVRRYCMQLKRKFFDYTGTKDCAIYADFDTTMGLKAMLKEFGLLVDKLQVIHQVKGETIETGYSEKERMLYLKEKPLYLLLADEPTLKMKNQAKKAVQVSNPNLSTVLTFPYTPFVGVRGVLWMVQQIYNA